MQLNSHLRNHQFILNSFLHCHPTLELFLFSFWLIIVQLVADGRKRSRNFFQALGKVHSILASIVILGRSTFVADGCNHVVEPFDLQTFVDIVFVKKQQSDRKKASLVEFVILEL